ncbi:DUF58 domain-containing protein [Calothrix rhizosoleniae]|uniref:DUF58 domain-containing protein n=1 Tax=Calothrix rhizosoleniae TaxID=888997 RepID=UPI000B49D951|nr:DUF58 domain-containing protein [Calothrix rhizosoleniae]
MIKNITNWLETHAVAPAYSGWVLAGITICFFGAAINTMAGWLYVISGISSALLVLSAILPPRSLVGLTVKRLPISAITAGDDLKVELEIRNQGRQAANLVQVADILPFILGKPIQQAIETIAPQKSYRWTYYHPTQRRGIYRWHTVDLTSAAPLGLFWCRRHRQHQASAVVYPPVLNLAHCPLVDRMGQEDSLRGDPSGMPIQTATEGLTRSLRPYRMGDPIRLIHWRTSARYGELRVRELEIVTSGQEIIIALDTAGGWQEENFEQAVIAAASLYFYAQKQQMQVQLWTASTGLIKGDRQVLEALAKTNALEDTNNLPPSTYPLIWLTQNPLTLSSLPNRSRWLMWENSASSETKIAFKPDIPGIAIATEKPLQTELQKSLNT